MSYLGNSPDSELIKDLELAVAGKADSGHTHSVSDIEGLAEALNNAIEGGIVVTPAATTEVSGTVKLAEINDLSSDAKAVTPESLGVNLGTKANSVHSHEISEVNQLGEALDAKSGINHTHSDLATLDSPELTGTPTAPTAAPGTNNNQLATTAFVQAIATGIVAGTENVPLATTSVAGKVTLAEISDTTSTDKAATPALVTAVVSGKAETVHLHSIDDITDLETILNSKASVGIDSIDLTGHSENAFIELTTEQLVKPILRVTGVLTSDVTIVIPDFLNQIWVVTNRTTSGNFRVFVKKKLSSGNISLTTVEVLRDKSRLIYTTFSEVLEANSFTEQTLDSVALTGNSTAVTQPASDNSAKIATTAFVATGLETKADSNHSHTNYVSTTGAQTVSGEKTFTEDLAVTKTSAEAHVVASYTGGSYASSFYLYNNDINIGLYDTLKTSILKVNKNTGHMAIGGTGSDIAFWTNSAERGSINSTGDLIMTGNVGGYSDIRLKTNLVKIDNALDTVDSLTGYTYTRIDTGKKETGLVAQDVLKVLPEAVIQGDYMSIAYGNMVGLLVEAIKELRKEINVLKGVK